MKERKPPRGTDIAEEPEAVGPEPDLKHPEPDPPPLKERQHMVLDPTDEATQT